MILRDIAEPKGRTTEVRAIEGSGFLEIWAEGYGEKTAADGHGSLLALELYEGRLRLLVFADIRQEGPTHILDLEEAREESRHE